MLGQEKILTLENYRYFRNGAHNLDMLLFRGDDIISNTIATLQGDDLFSHVGLVIRGDALPDCNLDPTKIYVLESTYSYKIEGMDNGPPDVLTNEYSFGVQLRDLELVLTSYLKNSKTRVMWLDLDLVRDLPKNLTPILEKYHKRPFTNINIIDYQRITPEFLEATKSFITTTLLQCWITDSFTCVDLVLCVYKSFGIITEDVAAKYPCDLVKIITSK